MTFRDLNRGAQQDGLILPAPPRFVRFLLLGCLAGLMFCIIPIHGFEIRLAWQLAAIWFAGMAFTAVLRSWLLQLFWLNCLVVTVIQLPPNYAAYISLLMMAIFLAAAEGFSRLSQRQIFCAMRVAALCLTGWIILQEAGFARTWFAPRNAGPFNPDDGGCLLAMCLPAFYFGWPGWIGAGVVLYGIFITKTTTAAIAALIGAGVFAFMKFRESKYYEKPLIAFLLVITLIGFGLSWSQHVRPEQQILGNVRFVVWQYAAKHIAVEPLGRGLASWESVFPFMAAGHPQLNSREPGAAGRPVIRVFEQAHNEYVQAPFEMGVQSLALIGLFLVLVAITIFRGSINPIIAAGIATVAVSSFGFHIFHIAPTALVGVAWIGIWMGENRESKKLSPIVLHWWRRIWQW